MVRRKPSPLSLVGGQRIEILFGNYILEKAATMDHRVEDRPALTDVVSTPMKDAGATILRVYGQSLDLEALAEMVYQAMLASAPQTESAL
jgi:hypothetical protein